MDATTGGAYGAGDAVRPGFHGRAGAMAPLVVKGLLLTVVTFGIYRFWYQTDIRRFLWGSTEIDGDGLEYTGRGVELFLGFLIALAVLIPFYGVVFALGVMTGPIGAGIVQSVSTFGLIFLAQFALYRARRYRLTRTVWRGVRLQQSGSGLAYAGRSFLWAIAAVLTLGLAYPWMRASLERYKMANTWYGDQRGAFSATGGQLFAKGIALWVLAIVLIVFPIVAAGVVAAHVEGGDLEETVEGFDALLVLLYALPILSLILAFAVVLPLYQAIEHRWWASGCAVGPASASCDLGLFAFFGVYLRFIGIVLLCALALGIVGGGVAFALGGAAIIGNGGAVSDGAGLAIGFALLASYLLIAFGVAALWQIFGVRPLWKRSFESVLISGLPALLAAQSQEPEANAFGEGVADALDFGGF